MLNHVALCYGCGAELCFISSSQQITVIIQTVSCWHARRESCNLESDWRREKLPRVSVLFWRQPQEQPSQRVELGGTCLGSMLATKTGLMPL